MVPSVARTENSSKSDVCSWASPTVCPKELKFSRNYSPLHANIHYDRTSRTRDMETSGISRLSMLNAHLSSEKAGFCMTTSIASTDTIIQVSLQSEKNCGSCGCTRRMWGHTEPKLFRVAWLVEISKLETQHFFSAISDHNASTTFSKVWSNISFLHCSFRFIR